MERRKRRPTFHRFDEPRPRNYIEEAEQAYPEYLEEELRPIKQKEEERILYFHECEKMECIIITDNKEVCRFCGTTDVKVYVRKEKVEI